VSRRRSAQDGARPGKWPCDRRPGGRITDAANGSVREREIDDLTDGRPLRPRRPQRGWFNRRMPEPSASAPADASELLAKQALMAAERTWLAWWRSALVATGGALAVGRVTPQVLHLAAWPYVLLGAGYGLLAVGMVVVGTQRHRRLARAAVAGIDSGLDSRVVAAFTVGGMVLGLRTVALVLAQS
jgi:uncharacterized membrane protein YidH (DUF202 family)